MLSSFIQPSIYKPIINNLGIGLSLSLFQTLLCSSHYNHLFLHPDILLNNFLFTSFTYGYDRYFDALDYNISKDKNKYSLQKQELYEAILKNQNILIPFYNLIFIIINLSLYFHDQNLLIFQYLLFSTIFYKSLKEKLSILKPFYISFMWILAGLVLPIQWQEGILDFDKNEIKSSFLLFFSMTNLLDIIDVQEDKSNNIFTLPVLLGQDLSLFLNNLIFIESSILILNNLNNYNIFLFLSNALFLVSTNIKLLKNKN